MSTARSTEMLNVQCLFGRSSQKSATGYNWAYRLLLVVRGPPWRMYVCMYVCMYDYIAVPVGHTLWHEVCAFLARASSRSDVQKRPNINPSYTYFTPWHGFTRHTGRCAEDQYIVTKERKGRSHRVEKRISMHLHKPHATSQPSRFSHTWTSRYNQHSH